MLINPRTVVRDPVTGKKYNVPADQGDYISASTKADGTPYTSDRMRVDSDNANANWQGHDQYPFYRSKQGKKNSTYKQGQPVNVYIKV